MERENEHNPFRCVCVNIGVEQFNTHCTWFFRALQPRGLLWDCVISWYVTAAAAGTGGVAGLMQTRGTAVSNTSCSFYLKWMIWRSFFPLEAHIFLFVLMEWEDGLVWECQCELLEMLLRGRSRSPLTRVEQMWPVPVWAWTAHCCGDRGQHPLVWKAKCNMSTLVVFKGAVLPMAIVWGEGSVTLTSSARFLFPWEMREKAGKNLVPVLSVCWKIQNKCA